MFIFIIVDALDKQLLDQFGIDLKLKYCGEYKTPPNPKTPFAVASMITGLPYKDMGKHETYLYNGYKRIYGDSVKTIFDFTKSAVIDIPCYNVKGTEGILELILANKPVEANMEAWLCFEKRVKKFYEALNSKKYRLVAVWFGILDRITHIWWTRPKIEIEKLEIAYREVAKIIRSVLDKGDVLVVSDHGRNHRPVAFYGANFPCKIEKYEDVFETILVRLSSETPVHKDLL